MTIGGIGLGNSHKGLAGIGIERSRVCQNEARTRLKMAEPLTVNRCRTIAKTTGRGFKDREAQLMMAGLLGREKVEVKISKNSR
jgi:hypothetical protein